MDSEVSFSLPALKVAEDLRLEIMEITRCGMDLHHTPFEDLIQPVFGNHVTDHGSIPYKLICHQKLIHIFQIARHWVSRKAAGLINPGLGQRMSAHSTCAPSGRRMSTGRRYRCTYWTSD
jgi:hypothetical protein